MIIKHNGNQYIAFSPLPQTLPAHVAKDCVSIGNAESLYQTITTGERSIAINNADKTKPTGDVSTQTR
jgi:hypothetical protein